MTSQIFQPITIGEIHLKNRVGLAPMTRTSATNDGLFLIIFDQVVE